MVLIKVLLSSLDQQQKQGLPEQNESVKDVYCRWDLFCSLGGSLAKISGFNQNRGLGLVLQEVLAEQQIEPTDRIVHAATADQQQVWIGVQA